MRTYCYHEHQSAAATMRILTFSTLFPNSVQSNHGIFVKTRLHHLLSDCPEVAAQVVAPVPWFPFTYNGFGSYGRFAKVARLEELSGISVEHPRYLVVPKIGMSLTPWTLYRASLPTLHRLKDSFDLIDAHYFYPDGVAAVWLGEALSKPVVITARGTDVNLIPRYFVPRRLIQSAARRASGIVTVSQALKDAVVDLGVASERITVLRNGVDLKLFRDSGAGDIRVRLGLKGRVLLSVGHLIERKGHNFIIEALPQLDGYSLAIVGEGPERARLENLASKSGVSERVRFVGGMPQTELPTMYSAADALVLASSREGWPNVLLEAMACGTPVVATNIWGNPEVVSDRAAGVLMRERSAEGVAEAVQRLFEERPLRAETRAFAERFSWKSTSDGQAQLFGRILKLAQRDVPEPSLPP